MLGLERVLSEDSPHLASGTELRRHQIDALAGMLTELISHEEQPAEPNGNGRPTAISTRTRRRRSVEDELDEEDAEHPEDDPGAERRYPVPPPDCVGQDDRGRRASWRPPERWEF